MTRPLHVRQHTNRTPPLPAEGTETSHNASIPANPQLTDWGGRGDKPMRPHQNNNMRATQCCSCALLVCANMTEPHCSPSTCSIKHSKRHSCSAHCSRHLRCMQAANDVQPNGSRCERLCTQCFSTNRQLVPSCAGYPPAWCKRQGLPACAPNKTQVTKHTHCALASNNNAAKSPAAKFPCC